jgi:glycosyltransferase involved in cell wall biosynthesis
MKIGIITTHSFPIPTPTHTGDIVILDLAESLDEMGHQVNLYAPAGTRKTQNGNLFQMRSSGGKASPSSWECEQECFESYASTLRQEDVIHDFSISKRITENLIQEGKRNVISTLLGGTWGHPNPSINIVVWSEAMRLRGLRGATDYENTPTPEMGGPPNNPIKDAHVVYGGIDTNWYTPTYLKEEFFLWMNRWHPAKGYHTAIELARKTGINLVMAGEHPDNEMFDYQKQCALNAVELAKELPNVKFEWLPRDPYHHEAKRELYRRARALLYTVQFQEPFGLSQVESLACGTPVIGINYGSVPEVIENNITGYVVGNNIGELSEATKLIDKIDPKICREHAVNRFDRKVMAKSYLAEYEAVIAGRCWGE